MQDIIWSGAVQHSGKGNETILKNAFANNKNLSDQQLINNYYDARINYVDSPSLRYLIPRYNSERQKALNMLKTQ